MATDRKAAWERVIEDIVALITLGMVNNDPKLCRAIECVNASLCEAREADNIHVFELHQQLDQLYGAPFSDRVYHALKSRAESAEAQVAALKAGGAVD